MDEFEINGVVFRSTTPRSPMVDPGWPLAYAAVGHPETFIERLAGPARGYAVSFWGVRRNGDLLRNAGGSVRKFNLATAAARAAVHEIGRIQ